MTSVLPEVETKVAKLKQKLKNDVRGKEESRSFLSFSRENLSISQSELEQGLNKQCSRPHRNTVLSVIALVVAVLCLGLETWKLRCSAVNAREIEELKRDVESLKHRILEENLWDALKAFEGQLYTGGSRDEDDDAGEADIDNADYDSAYDDNFSHDYSNYYASPAPSYGARPSDFPDYSSTIAPVPSPPSPPSADKAMMDLLSAPSLRKAEVKHGQASKKNDRDGSHKNDKDHRAEDERKTLEEKLKNTTKQKRHAPGSRSEDSAERRGSLKKRSIGDHEVHSRRLVLKDEYQDHTRRTMPTSPDDSLKDRSVEVRGRHPPKKYTHHTLDTGSVPSLEVSEPNVHGEHRQPKKSARRLKKNLPVSKRIYAAHYSADRELPGVSECNHRCGRHCNTSDTGHCHRDRIFTAWRATEWVDELMGQHFTMQNDGSLIINHDGLYLVYAQIHYVDTVHEAGFNLEVNDRIILKCTVSKSGQKIDQTCFSAQVTPLKQNDSLALKETGESPRGAVLEAIDSFFGVVRLGDIKTLSKRYSSQ
ncbi:TNF superfamily member 12 eiger isoform X2 [Nomia melanderi]|uniref:TNF superfamily member 12 eiger isoform X2 n=1 Tax=Nomia melanderi TaxID=2448451 RepID=UPI00130466A9|nr:uncharacterized protein LOC116428362 isoform X2 [Nomia melanderi]